MTSLTLPAKLENLQSIQEFISSAAADCGFTEDRIQKLQLASEEALVNIFSYAYPEGTDGDVTVTCDCGPETDFQVIFEDRGTPFDMLSVAAPDTGLSLEDRGIGGLGIFFIRQMTDSVNYRRENGKNVLTFTMAGA